MPGLEARDAAAEGAAASRVALPASPDGRGAFAVAAALGDNHSMFLDASGGVLACGENKEGQLGIGATLEGIATQHRANWSNNAQSAFWRELSETRPDAVPEDRAAAAAGAAAGGAGDGGEGYGQTEEGQHTRATWVVTGVEGGQQSTPSGVAGTSGTVGAWAVPAALAAFSGQRVISLAAARYFSAAATMDGAVWTWGGGFNGELGHGPEGTTWLTAPRRVSGRSLNARLADGGGATAVAAGGNFCAALTAAGGLVVWGRPPPGLGAAAAVGQEGGLIGGGKGGVGGAGAGACYHWPAAGGSGGVRLTGVACGRNHVVVTDGARVWVAGGIGGWVLGVDGHPEEVDGLRQHAASSGGIASVAAGLGGACAALTGDGALLMFGAPVHHLGRGNLPSHDPTIPVLRTLLAGTGAGGRALHSSTCQLNLSYFSSLKP